MTHEYDDNDQTTLDIDLSIPIRGEFLGKKERSQIVIQTDRFTQLNSEFFKQSHKFVFGQITLTAREHDIFGLLLARIRDDHWEDVRAGNEEMSPDYTFNTTVLSEWLNVDVKDIYATINKPAEMLSGKKIGIRDDKTKKFKHITLFKEVSYEKGVLLISPNDKLRSEWLSLSGGHAQIFHKPFRGLNKTYPKKLYTILSRFKEVGKGKLRPFSLEELHAHFGLIDSKGNFIKPSFKENKVFIERCIKIAIIAVDKFEPRITFLTFTDETKNINKKTFGYKTIKQGKKIIAIEFLFFWEQKPVLLEIDSGGGESDLDKIIKRSEYKDAVSVYLILKEYEFERDHPRNPSEAELLMMMSDTPSLLSNGFELDSDFMMNYTLAMTDAKLNQKED